MPERTPEPSPPASLAVSQLPLTNPRRIRDLLGRYNLRADKGFGQNFLTEPAVLGAIIGAANLTREDTVLEVGPGLGVLTTELVTRAGWVTSVELDARLLPALAETLGSPENLTLVHGDGLEFDLSTLPAGSLLVANLPYNVGTPIVVRALESGRFRRLVFLVQKEVAQRLTAAPGTPAYGALSLIVAHFGHATRVRDVPPSAFLPPPSVTSSVVRIETFPDKRPDPGLFKLIHQGFAHRRKTLKKNLLMAAYPAAAVETALGAAGLDPRIRAEALALETFATLYRHLFEV